MVFNKFFRSYILFMRTLAQGCMKWRDKEVRIWINENFLESEQGFDKDTLTVAALLHVKFIRKIVKLTNGSLLFSLISFPTEFIATYGTENVSLFTKIQII